MVGSIAFCIVLFVFQLWHRRVGVHVCDNGSDLHFQFYQLGRDTNVTAKYFTAHPTWLTPMEEPGAKILRFYLSTTVNEQEFYLSESSSNNNNNNINNKDITFTNYTRFALLFEAVNYRTGNQPPSNDEVDMDGLFFLKHHGKEGKTYWLHTYTAHSCNASSAGLRLLDKTIKPKGHILVLATLHKPEKNTTVN